MRDVRESTTVAGSDLVTAVACALVGSLPVFLVASLSVQISDSLHFGPDVLGGLVALYFLGAATASIPLSRLVGVIGALRAMRLGCWASVLPLLALAFVARSQLALALTMALGGMASAAVMPATNLFIAARIPRSRQGMAFGLKQGAVPLCTLLGGIAVPGVALTVGWRWAFVGAAGYCVVVGALLPRSKVSLKARRARPRVRLRLAGTLPLAVVTVGFGLGVGAASSLPVFVVASAVAGGTGTATAGLLAALGGAAAAITRVGVGTHADRGTRSPLRVVCGMLALGAVGYAALAVAAAWWPVLLVPAVVVAFAAGWGWNGLFNLAVVWSYPSVPAQATGLTGVGGRVGGVAGPAVFGLIAVRWSFTTAWWLTAAAAVAAACILLLGSRLLPAVRGSSHTGADGL